MGSQRTVRFCVPENFYHLQLVCNRPNLRDIEVAERPTPTMCRNRPMSGYRENSSEATYFGSRRKNVNDFLFAVATTMLTRVMPFLFMFSQCLRSVCCVFFVRFICWVRYSVLNISKRFLFVQILDSLVSTLLILTHTHTWHTKYSNNGRALTHFTRSNVFILSHSIQFYSNKKEPYWTVPFSYA